MPPMNPKKPSQLRPGRLLAGTVVAALAVSSLTIVAAQNAGAVAAQSTAPTLQAQSVGNFVDATLGGQPLDPIAFLKHAAAQASAATPTPNPLDVSVLKQINLPLTGALQLPTIAGIHLGAANQVAQAQPNGYSYGASGAVSNSGGVSIGGDNAFPADGTINLNASNLAGNTPLPIPGGVGAADALGSVKVSIGAVSALAQTPKGVGAAGSTNYNIADLNLQISSPLVGGLLGTVGNLLGSVVTSLTSALPGGSALPKSCFLATGTLPNLSLEGGAIVVTSTGADAGTLTISLDRLLQQLGLDLNHLPANTDLLAYLLSYLASPDGLAKALQGAIDGLLDPLEAQFTACSGALNAIPVLGPVLVGLVKTLTNGQHTLETTLNSLVVGVAGKAGVNPLAPIASLLSKLIAIGVNVQPNGPKGPAGAAYVEHLNATAKQGTPVVPGQTVVRAIEVTVAAAAGSSLPGLGSLPTLPGLNSLTGAQSLAGVQSLAAPNSGLLTLALGNAAAGPNAAAPTTPTTTPTPTSPTSSGTPAGPGGPGAPANPAAIPNAVPAGFGTHGGTPMVPIVLLIAGLMLAAGGAVAFKVRATHLG